jgi:hypothetical protein
MKGIKRENLMRMKKADLVELCLGLSEIAEANKGLATRSVKQAQEWKDLYESENMINIGVSVH